MSENALIVVDMLNDFVHEKGALYCGQPARDIIPFVKGRIEACRKSGDLVIYLQDSHAEDDKEFGAIRLFRNLRHSNAILSFRSDATVVFSKPN